MRLEPAGRVSSFTRSYVLRSDPLELPEVPELEDLPELEDCPEAGLWGEIWPLPVPVLPALEYWPLPVPGPPGCLRILSSGWTPGGVPVPPCCCVEDWLPLPDWVPRFVCWEPLPDWLPRFICWELLPDWVP